MNTKFENVRMAIDRIDELLNRVKTEDYTKFTADELAIILNPMGYLAMMFEVDYNYGKDLMYSLISIYKPTVILGEDFSKFFK